MNDAIAWGAQSMIPEFRSRGSSGECPADRGDVELLHREHCLHGALRRCGHLVLEQIIHEMGGIAYGTKPGADTKYGLENPGRIIHEVGTTRMGDDPNKSVLNKFNQAHEVKNLFVVDGGAFVSQADKNPTWTILALSMRASEYIVDQLKKQNI